jgi:hypothetical protein
MLDVSRGAGLSLTAVALATGLAGSAWFAAPMTVPAAVPRQREGGPCGSQATAESCVAAFCGAYLHAAAAPGDGAEALAWVRGTYLTPELDAALTARPGAVDPVFNSRDVPLGYDTVVQGKGHIRVLLYWREGLDTALDVTVDLAAHRISAIAHEAARESAANEAFLDH